MKMNKIALCLILVFALAFSTYAAVDVSFSPQPVSPGESLNITVTNGSYYKYADIYDSGNNLKTTISLCNHPNNCNGTNSVIYNVPSNFRAGVARLRVYDNSLRAYIYGSFSVIGGNCHSNSLWHYSYCNSGCLCDIGEGDCDNDNECKDGLNCVNNLGSNYGQASWIDVCEVAPPTGSIRVNSNTRYANIYLDGIYKGSTGYWKSRTISQVEAGYHSLNVTKSGYSAYTTPVNVVAGQTAYVNANLTSITGSIRVNSNTRYANIYLDGIYKGSTGYWKSRTISQVEAGYHSLNVTKSGYSAYTTPVNVVAGQTAYVNANLTSITGSIRVNSNTRYANIYLDGIYKGSTGYWKSRTISQVEAGYHSLNVTKSGYSAYTTPVNVVAGQTAYVNANLQADCSTRIPWSSNYCTSDCPCSNGNGDCDNSNECQTGVNCVNNVGSNYGQTWWFDVCEGQIQTGSIYVTSTPSGANLYLDGDYLGTTPKTINEASVGNHALNLTKSGYSPYTASVNVVAGQTTNVNGNLTLIPPPTPSTGSIYVTSTPSGANLYLDGDYLGTTPKTINETSVGNHALNLTKSGYHPYTTSVNVVAGQTTNVNATLTLIPTPTPSTGSIYVTSTPSGANLYLDGDYLGTTPKTIDNTSVGNHTLNVIKSGYPPYTALVNVVAGQTTNVNATLTIIDATSPSLTAFFTATTNNSATLIVNATDSDSYVDNIGLWYKSPAHSYWYKWGNMYYDCNQQQLCYQEHNITSIDGAGNYTFWVGAYNRDRYSSLKYPSIYFTS